MAGQRAGSTAWRWMASGYGGLAIFGQAAGERLPLGMGWGGGEPEAQTFSILLSRTGF
jgi:hypothetical protein